VLSNYRKFLDQDCMTCPDPNQPPRPCAFHLLKDSAPIQTKKRVEREKAVEVENSTFSTEVQTMMEIDIRDEDMEDSAFSQEIQVKVEEDPTSAEEMAGGWTLKTKREYVTVQDEGLGGMSDWKRRKLERKRPGSKYENFKIARLEEEDDVFVLKTEQGDLRYTYSTRMEMDLEEQVSKTERGDFEDYSSIQLEMDVDEQDIFAGKIRSLGPGRSLVGYPHEYGIDGKAYCGKCFVLETEQEDLGDSSSAVVKMETDKNNLSD
jgi:hypothetical protein